MKKIVAFAGVLASLAAAPAQAQWSTGFTPDNNTNGGVEFWDNRSTDGRTCNIGYVVTGVAGSAGNACANQRPAAWLPYAGPAMNDFLLSSTFSFFGGSVTFGSVGGDIAGLNRDWGFWESVGAGPKTFTNINTAAVLPVTYDFDASTQWGFWVNTGTVRTSDVDAQFALFRGANNQYVIGFEDVDLMGSDMDFQDMIVSATIVPEPSSVMLVMGGLLGLAGVARRRKQA